MSERFETRWQNFPFLGKLIKYYHLLNNTLFKHIRHELKMNCPSNDTGGMSPNVWVTVGQNPFYFLNLCLTQKHLWIMCLNHINKLLQKGIIQATFFMSSYSTFSRAMLSSFSCWGGVLSRSTSQASFIRGMTLRKISVEMKREQMGSAISHPNCLMRIVDIITPTLPNVSASTWRNTPENIKVNIWIDIKM